MAARSWSTYFTIEEHGAAVLSDGREELVAFNDIPLAACREGLVQARMNRGDELTQRGDDPAA